MKILSQTLAVVVAAWLVGCVSYDPAPLSLNHPAHADAAMGVPLSPSTTLAYTAGDLQFPGRKPAEAQAQSGHDRHNVPDGSPMKLATGEGKVIAVVPESSQIVVEHGVIKGFMDAMTMGYRVEPKQLLDGIKTGDQVRFAIDAEKKAIVGLEKLP